MKLLLDTNVLIDYYARRQPYFEDVMRLRIASCFGDVELWACSQSFPDVEYVLRRAIPTTDLRMMIAKSLGFLRVCTVSADDVRDGLESGWPDLEDYYVASSAKRVGADYVVTRGERGFARSSVPAITPKRLFEVLRDEHGITYEEIAFE